MIIRFPSLKTKIVEFVLIASNFIHITIFGLDILRFKNQGGDGLEQWELGIGVGGVEIASNGIEDWAN